MLSESKFNTPREIKVVTNDNEVFMFHEEYKDYRQFQEYLRHFHTTVRYYFIADVGRQKSRYYYEHEPVFDQLIQEHVEDCYLSNIHNVTTWVSDSINVGLLDFDQFLPQINIDEEQENYEQYVYECETDNEDYTDFESWLEMTYDIDITEYTMEPCQYYLVDGGLGSMLADLPGTIVVETNYGTIWARDEKSLHDDRQLALLARTFLLKYS